MEISPPATSAPLCLADRLRDQRLIVFGGTGFLGKVWLALLLSKFPQVGHVHLVVRPKEGLDVRDRFQRRILTSEVFSGLREAHGSRFEEFISQKVTPIAGDISQPLCGLSSELREELQGSLAAVVNVAGVVQFTPPLDEALQVNAFGCQNLVALARELGDCPVLHTSTCFVAGSRTGPIEEVDPRSIPFPRAGELEASDWDPDREIKECLDVIEQARHRANDAFRQSRFLDEAKSNLAAKSESGSGQALRDELARVRRKFVEAQLAELGTERARYWGWPNTYTYTKSIGEQIIASSGLRFCIVRPSIVESTNEFPFPGWNEGINTSAPYIFLIRQGGLQVPGSDNNLDMIPCDMVGGAILLALGELLDGTNRPVYQAAASDLNPCTMARFFELSGLHKRRLYRTTQKGGPLVAALQSRYESALLSKKEYEAFGPHKLSEGARSLGGLLRKAAKGPLSSVLGPASDVIESFAVQQKKLARVMDTFLPFTAEYQYVFRADAVRAAAERLSPEERSLIPWSPETLDWRKWFLEVHAPALERHVFPEMERRLQRQVRAPRPHDSLTGMLDTMVERFDLKVALQRTEQEGLSRLSYRDLRQRALGVAHLLKERGVGADDRILLCGQNDPAWVVGFFGILYAGATVVPLDAAIEIDAARAIAHASRAKVILADERRAGLAHALDVHHIGFSECLNVSSGDLEAPPPLSEGVACLIYTSGTTGAPKGVMLSHGNLTSLLSSLAPLFPLTTGDRVLSVLPLHHTFELTCGMLLPLSRGARVVYLDELSSERLAYGLKSSRATALIGVPALWEMLERRIVAKVAQKGPFAEWAFDAAVHLSRAIGQQTGLDVGRTLFGQVHSELGGHLRYLVSGGAALPSETHSLFQGLGLHLSEGYGLTESAPVLTVAAGGPRARSGSVGLAVPGVELRIKSPSADGVGEVLARGPNVMLGYSDDLAATSLAIDEEGWLHTGDLGKLDGKGRLTLIGRAKDVVVSKTGENIYPDDVEARIGEVPHVAEYCLLGVPDGRGGERLGCAAVPQAASETSRAERHDLCRAALTDAFAALPLQLRPVLVCLFDEELPRTTTRKVKRSELRRWMEGAASTGQEPSSSADNADPLLSTVQQAVAAISRRRPADVTPNMSLRGDLGFDSLMALELLVALETKLGTALDAERLNQATTVEELVHALGRESQARSRTAQIEQDDSVSWSIPEPLREAAMEWMARGQDSFYERLMRTKVTGRAFIPHNRPTLVVANHTSHLDMGLVKYALGSYGRDLVTFAAQDYFFEGNPYKRAFFEQFSHLEPMPRTGSLRSALRRAGEVLESGKTVLIFPEGTRTDDGRLADFKPAIGHLVLHHQVDVLPIWLEGAFEAMPRGSKLPRSRRLEARIGRPLPARELEKAVQGLSASEAARAVTRIAREAVLALSKRQNLDLAHYQAQKPIQSEPPAAEGLSAVFAELERRFVPGAVDQPISYYFSLGDERWTVRAGPTEIEVARGKQVDAADCVLKTSPALFERIVREAWVPGPADFMSGKLKTSNVGHLLTMQKLFRLSTPSDQLQSNMSRAAGADFGAE